MFDNVHLDCLPAQWTFDDLLAEKQKVKTLEEELRHVRKAHARLKGTVAAQRRRESASSRATGAPRTWWSGRGC